ncbi:MAG: DUF423 domain-containing protein [Acetobacteraceae bacterium]
MERVWVGLGALYGLLAVAFSALAAHLLAGRVAPAGMALVATGLRIQGWHALALLACGLWAPRGGRLAHAAGAAFALGTAIFCGTLYGLALGAGMIAGAAPVGGTTLMAGWVLLGLSAFRGR